MRLREVAVARLNSAAPLRTDEVVLLPVCIGRRASRVRVKDIFSEMDVAWLEVTIPEGME